MGSCENLMLIMGSNPLPNYITAKIMRPKMVHLIHTKETETLAIKLKEILERSEISGTLHPMGSVREACKIEAFYEKLFDDLDADFHLNYTGGTKVMAAYARMIFDRYEKEPCHASYLDDAKGALIRDDGFIMKTLDQVDINLSLQDMLEMHGITTSPLTVFNPSDIMVEDSRKIFEKSKDNPKCLEELFLLFQKDKDFKSQKLKYKEAKNKPLELHIDGLDLSKRQFPQKGDSEQLYDEWQGFLQGKWLEFWTANVLSKVLPPETSVYVNIRCEIEKEGIKRPFEIDLAFIHRNRLFIMSCTTGDSLSLCKSKLFEASVRGRQMGGDLARIALVTLIDGKSNGQKRIDELRRDLAYEWTKSKYTRVFGKQDLIGWSENISDELEDWLQS
ncbi:MAG: DUF1887 family protein [Candidatus Hydrogenedens sp.]|jgi:hypothetical protein|nr:DUF1887 family protein [Candidatus Hydrogenedens sp.]